MQLNTQFIISSDRSVIEGRGLRIDTFSKEFYEKIQKVLKNNSYTIERFNFITCWKIRHSRKFHPDINAGRNNKGESQSGKEVTSPYCWWESESLLKLLYWNLPKNLWQENTCSFEQKSSIELSDKLKWSEHPRTMVYWCDGTPIKWYTDVSKTAGGTEIGILILTENQIYAIRTWAQLNDVEILRNRKADRRKTLWKNCPGLMQARSLLENFDRKKFKARIQQNGKSLRPLTGFLTRWIENEDLRIPNLRFPNWEFRILRSRILALVT